MGVLITVPKQGPNVKQPEAATRRERGNVSSSNRKPLFITPVSACMACQELNEAGAGAGDMPFFKKSSPKSDENRAKLEHKLYLAREDPEPVFDLSECELTDVPSGVYAKCRVFRKEALNLNTNKLTSLKGGGHLKDLAELQTLDLHSNVLSCLPDEIGLLQNLRALNVADNKLKKLPSSLGNLCRLETLNLSRNRFRDFPAIVLQLKSLKALDIRQNAVHRLPVDLCCLRNLSNLELDCEKCSFPSEEICREGTEAIMKFLCSQKDVDYVPPVEETVAEETGNPRSIPCTPPADENVHFHQFEEKKERRRQELLQMEAVLKDTYENQAQFSEETQERRRKLLSDLALEQDQIQDAILDIQSKKELEKQKLLNDLSHLENHSAALIEQISREVLSKKNEALLEAIQNEQKETEALFTIKQEELESLRKKEVLAAMRDILEREERQKMYSEKRDDVLKSIQVGDIEADRKLRDVISERDQEQQHLISQILAEEEFQREAFKAFQLKRDQTHNQITMQIKMIEKELTRLTEVEIKRKDLKVAVDLDVLAEHRAQLAVLLARLLDDRAKREKELQERLLEMEKRREDEMEDFWLVQYQKLMDMKPKGIAESEDKLEPAVREILELSGASAYSTLFAVKNVTFKQLLYMCKDDLLQLGILSECVREAILEIVDQYRSSEQEEAAVVPSAPSAEVSPDATPSAPPLISPASELKLWFSSECVVCLEMKSLIVFLPCGHVCCCWTCGESIQLCPLCRLNVENKLTLV